MLAGMQLDVFTPMREGPMTPEDIAHAIGVKADRLRLLLWALVAAGLLTEKDGRFSNTQETNQFLVKGAPCVHGRQTRKPFRLMGLETQNCGFNSNWCAAG